jgi:hypothetical protein
MRHWKVRRSIPPLPTNGNAQLSITTVDQGNSGSGGAHSASDNIDITVNISGAPTATNDSYSVNEDNVLNVPAASGLLHNDVNPSGQPLTASVVGAPGHASAFTLNADGSFSYTPTADFVGTDTFTYQIDDGTNTSNVGIVTIVVGAVNDAPAGSNNTVSTLEGAPYTFASADFGFSDPNDSPANALSAVTYHHRAGCGQLDPVGRCRDSGAERECGQHRRGQLEVHTGGRWQRCRLCELHVPSTRRRRHRQRRRGSGSNAQHDDGGCDFGQRCTGRHEQYRHHQRRYAVHLRGRRLWLHRS